MSNEIYIEQKNLFECNLCNNDLIYSEEGFLICIGCGFVNKTLCEQPEWKLTNDNSFGEDNSRCGLPGNNLFIESSFICKVISKNNKKNNLKQFIEYQCPYKEKSLYDVYQYLLCIAQNNNILLIIIDDAISFYKKIFEYEQSFRGNNKLGIIAASLYISFKINGVPRTAKEVSNIFKLDVKYVIQGCKNVYNILNYLEQNLDNDLKTNFMETKPIHLIDRYSNILNLDDDLNKLSQFIAIQIDKNHYLQENNPQSITCGIFYYIIKLYNLNYTVKDLNSICDTNNATIKKCYNKIKKYENEIVPHSILSKFNII
jgi:transcription initiation factor TFIIIB Brf1 subunit/transcription initiation factor TFIIB